MVKIRSARRTHPTKRRIRQTRAIVKTQRIRAPNRIAVDVRIEVRPRFQADRSIDAGCSTAPILCRGTAPGSESDCRFCRQIGAAFAHRRRSRPPRRRCDSRRATPAGYQDDRKGSGSAYGPPSGWGVLIRLREIPAGSQSAMPHTLSSCHPEPRRDHLSRTGSNPE